MSKPCFKAQRCACTEGGQRWAAFVRKLRTAVNFDSSVMSNGDWKALVCGADVVMRAWWLALESDRRAEAPQPCSASVTEAGMRAHRANVPQANSSPIFISREQLGLQHPSGPEVSQKSLVFDQTMSSITRRSRSEYRSTGWYHMRSDISCICL